MLQSPQQTNISFDGLGIAPRILEILDRMRFTHPTTIQHKAIPIGIEGKDVIGIAQTGTGKTLAFAIPIIQRLSQRKKGRALILAPTRELAVQINETFEKIAPSFGIKTVVIIGGASMHMQLAALRKNPRVIIATPGRLVDHIGRRTVFLADTNVLVLDEADRMFDMGFMPQIERILKVVPKNKQTMLFSATISGEVVKIAAAYMKLPVHVEVAPSGTAAEGVIQELFIVKKNAKKRLLLKLLQGYHGAVLVFSRTKMGAGRIARFIREAGHSAAEIHSNRSLNQRKQALEGFKSGRYRVLVATDIAARGIDVIGIELVLNYDIPDDTENYVHRIGRTGRAGHKGRAISFATPEQGGDVRNIERLIKTALPIAEHPEFPRERFTQHSSKGSQSRQFHGRRRHKQRRRKRPRRSESRGHNT
ncbi:MAG: DEAD/DEAH box helicase [Candidatus Omnitrophota bacterium]|nr:MAG: DEAD/DEAH box helicase [Candidatus Omnitrophota bacterium]